MPFLYYMDFHTVSKLHNVLASNIFILLLYQTVSHSLQETRQLQHTTAQFFAGRMPFLPPNKQCQSTEGTTPIIFNKKSVLPLLVQAEQAVKWQIHHFPIQLLTSSLHHTKCQQIKGSDFNCAMYRFATDGDTHSYNLAGRYDVKNPYI